MTLTAHTLRDLEQARRRNAARLKRTAEEWPVPDDPDRIEQWMPIRYVVLTRPELQRLLVFGSVALSKYHPSMGINGKTCPWGSPGDYRWVHEPVILHPRLGAIFSNDPNWMEFARKYPREHKMPVTLRRLFIRVGAVKRVGFRWEIEIIRAKALPVPESNTIEHNRKVRL